jgi:hypothetical protein
MVLGLSEPKDKKVEKDHKMGITRVLVVLRGIRDFRGIRAFLLNAPYKIDSMVWMMLM